VVLTGDGTSAFGLYDRTSGHAEIYKTEKINATKKRVVRGTTVLAGEVK
jgi:hypothetical protein